jgi:RecG-like helicase
MINSITCLNRVEKNVENKKEVYHISTKLLIKILNLNRENKGLGKLEDALIARKLGILYTFKTNTYLNFKDDCVNLMLDELTILEEIIDYYFNVEMKADTMKCFTIKLENKQNTLITNEQNERMSLEEILNFYTHIEINAENKSSDSKIEDSSSNGNFFSKLTKLFS